MGGDSAGLAEWEREWSTAYANVLDHTASIAAAAAAAAAAGHLLPQWYSTILLVVLVTEAL